jgi:hypothetical protein
MSVKNVFGIDLHNLKVARDLFMGGVQALIVIAMNVYERKSSYRSIVFMDRLF